MEQYSIWAEKTEHLPAYCFGTQVAVSFRVACIKQFGYEDVDFDPDNLTYCGKKLYPSKENV